MHGKQHWQPQAERISRLGEPEQVPADGGACRQGGPRVSACPALSLSLSLFVERCDVRTSFGSVVVRRVQRLRIYLLDYTDYTLLTNGQEPGLA